MNAVLSDLPQTAAEHSRRNFVRLGALGLTVPQLLQRSAVHGAPSGAVSLERFGQAKSCIVLFAWGGMSHLDTWDLKPDAPREVRGEFHPIASSVPGTFVSEHMPRLATQAHRLAIVRSVHHKASDHREAAYWNLTGRQPRVLGLPALMPSRADWPSLGSQVARVRASVPASHAKPAAPQETAPLSELADALPRTISIPYPIADRGLLNGQDGGFLGAAFDPIYVRPSKGTAYKGVSPVGGDVNLTLPSGVSESRFLARRELLTTLESAESQARLQSRAELVEENRRKALDMLLSPAVRAAFDVNREPRPLRESYGEHICSQSALMARRLSEAGVPLVTVYCSVGDLNGSAGDNWDTHGNNFNRLKHDLLPPIDRAASALLDDLADRGRLDDTLVVILTEFGRTPQINGSAGRDHYPGCYSVAFAGGGICGGRVYGSSDDKGIAPADFPCGPEDLHATIFHALGIDAHFEIHDLEGRPYPLTQGAPLPLF